MHILRGHSCLNGLCHGDTSGDVREMRKRNHKKGGRRMNTLIPKLCPIEQSMTAQDYLRPKLSYFLLFLKWENRIFFFNL